ncbi:hypothetical protein EC957_006674 [Mortierella hygrophila]|uniref:Uncharacterized protein n=1 Tax=Mortierella hygrophila TaxID=979708 RepID=A0A9P6JYW8_9FUNG|nr:hypothetical protein EC957_006674 [Mortierella hygrophila]
MTTIAQINKFGGTRSPLLLHLTTRIWNHGLKAGARLKTTYVPSQFNLADAPSRRMVAQLEWFDRSLILSTFGGDLGSPHHQPVRNNRLFNISAGPSQVQFRRDSNVGRRDSDPTPMEIDSLGNYAQYKMWHEMAWSFTYDVSPSTLEDLEVYYGTDEKEQVTEGRVLSLAGMIAGMDAGSVTHVFRIRNPGNDSFAAPDNPELDHVYTVAVFENDEYFFANAQAESLRIYQETRTSQMTHQVNMDGILDLLTQRQTVT